ncbi:MAG: DUF6273 domain-containing protein [Micrococcales bacterium]|nr:DUF6273 domain-containing protein [Micrococcales bacterium]
MGADTSGEHDAWDLAQTVRDLQVRVAALEAAMARVPGGDHQVDSTVAAWGTPSRPDARLVALEDAVTRLGGEARANDQDEWLGDYQTRVPATVGEVAQVCNRIAGSWSSTWSSPVVLSGIEWWVLDVVRDETGHRALLLSDRVVTQCPYHKDESDITWELSDLRRWLNNVFGWTLGMPLVLRVVTSKLTNEPNLVWDTAGGNDTADKFFLLSMQEAVEYLGKDKYVSWERIRKQGYYELGERGAARSDDGERTLWWLRSPGRYPNHAAAVFPNGVLPGFGRVAHGPSGGVRPAFWLNLQP